MADIYKQIHRTNSNNRYIIKKLYKQQNNKLINDKKNRLGKEMFYAFIKKSPMSI